MSYSERRGPNVSEYVANLNAIPSAQDLQSSSADNFNLDDELAMFTNTQFYDFDSGNDVDIQPIADWTMALADDFAFPDFNFQQPPQQSYGSDPLPGVLDTDLYPAPSSVGSPSVPDQTPTAANVKRKAAASPDNYEEASRMAAEEDKRRRNTAASARFRVKKKQREQALEKSAKEMSDKVQALEGRINQLETENKWLKNLITERGERKHAEGEDVASLLKKYSEGVKSDDRIKNERKDGVGTKA
ncbi:hypothetical protein OIDMADRAFT_101511 [Oidiodendron maius Zn]|uniref:BZIP domain-containing protein n=1 Tax=Oidiodendron maius (strain Zn) TaxID=913774 RepID=A0A0C3HNE1_OIDMZ|nr:hypothetical protein OIDMADRAFT_101511 [Oidiodendron maius Zn]